MESKDLIVAKFSSTTPAGERLVVPVRMQRVFGCSTKKKYKLCEKKNNKLQFCDYAWSLPDKFMRGEGLEAKSTSG